MKQNLQCLGRGPAKLELEPEILSIFCVDTIAVVGMPLVLILVIFIPLQNGSLTIIPFEEFKASLGLAVNSLSDPEIDRIRVIMDGMADVMFSRWKKKLFETETN